MNVRLTPWMVATSATIAVTLILAAGVLSASAFIAFAVAGGVTCGFIAGLLIGVEAAALRFAPRIDGARADLALRDEWLAAANYRIEVLEAETARRQQQSEMSAELAESHLARLREVEARLAGERVG